MKKRFMTTALIDALAALVIIILPAISHASDCAPSSQICVNQACDSAQVGTSTMDFDKKNIVVCLIKNDGSGYLWKAMSQGPQGFPANYPVTDAALFGGLYNCYFYTDATANVYLRIAFSFWNQDIDTGWVKSAFLTHSMSGAYNPASQLFGQYAKSQISCLAEPTGIYVNYTIVGEEGDGAFPYTTQKLW
jgi:hypothetical protein